MALGLEESMRFTIRLKDSESVDRERKELNLGFRMRPQIPHSVLW